ncbi:MAG: hypothetical protein HY425_00180 [Candidatus Levybacteria bacterium]|nr:hypothetical protein [Candidatus Levybacteria bacterium]
MTQLISIKYTRDKLAEVINQVAIAGDEFIVTKFGEPKAMIVPIIKAKTQKSVFEETFGAWKGRKDIKNTAKWVAALRKKMSTRQ